MSKLEVKWHLPSKFDIVVSPLADVSLANFDVKTKEILNVIDRSWEMDVFFLIK